MMQRYCLFAYYDPEPSIRPDVRHYLAQLVACGYAVHVALSGHPTVDASAFKEQQGLENVTIWPRRNKGLDFGAWQFLMRQLPITEIDEVLLVNDSVFGPLRPLEPYLSSLRRRNADAWGLVFSHEIAPHLQSWFIGLTGPTFFKPAVRRVFALPFETMTKAEIIFHGEIGLGVALRAEGCHVTAAWASTNRLMRLIRGNPMHHGWRALAAKGLVPFIKTEVLRDDPMSLGSDALWPSLLDGNTFFDAAWIRSYLDRTPKRNNALPNPWRHRLIQWLYSLSIARHRAEPKTLPSNARATSKAEKARW